MRKTLSSVLLVSLCQLVVTAPRALADGDGSNINVDATLDQFLGTGSSPPSSPPPSSAPGSMVPATGASADDGGSAKSPVKSSAKPPEAQQASKGKRGKSPKTDSPATALTAAPAASSVDGSNANVDATLDQYLGTGSASPGGSPPSSSAPGSIVPISPSGPAGGTDDSASAPGGAADSGMSAPTQDSSGHDAPDPVYNGDKAIPDSTLRAGELNNQAVSAIANKQFQRAIDYLKQALIADPNYAQGKSNLTIAYFDMAVDLYNDSKYTEALPYIEKALAMAKQAGREDGDMKQLYDDCKQAIKENAGK
jgi:hypothetical protein